MKKFSVLLMLLAALTVFNGCQKDEPVVVDEQLLEVVKPDVYAENGYLVFKDARTFSQTCDFLETLNEKEYEEWAKAFDFISARLVYLDADKKLSQIKNWDEYDELKRKYKNDLIFDNDGGIFYPFYATAWDKVLNIDGVVKIGNTLNKFYGDRQVMIMDGNKDDLKDNLLYPSNNNRVKTFYPNKTDMLKSVQWGTLASGIIYNDANTRRLEYSYQLISFYYTGYGYSNTYYTENGFEMRLKMEQKAKGFLGIWSLNKTIFEIRNQYLHLEFDKMIPPSSVNIYPPEVINQSFPDYTSTETTGVTYKFIYYYDVVQGYAPQVEPRIYNHTFRFWSRGIGENKSMTINYSNQ